MKMKQLFLFAAGLFTAATVFGQAAYVTPVPTNVTDTVYLWVDVTQPDCYCPNLQDVTEDVYMWTWNPGDPNGGNGEWNNSNESMKMTRDPNNPNIYFMKMVPTEFYNMADVDIYEKGFSYLAKLKDGGSGGGTDLENKSGDFNISVIPPPCNRKLCPHPEVFLQEDYFTAFYNNNLEQNAAMQNLNPDEVGIHILAKTASGQTYEVRPQNEIVAGTDENEMMIYDAVDDLYYFTIIPEDYFEIPEGEEVTQLLITFIKRGADTVGQPPSAWRSDTEVLNVGCR